MTQISRRTLLHSSAAAAAISQLPRAVSAQSAPLIRQRMDAPDFRVKTLDSYKKAIAAMHALPPSDPRNWYRQSLIHMADCPHGNWWFLPWHRGYLVHFERMCRELSGDPEFALPYWDWTATSRIPATFFDDLTDPGNAAFVEDFAAFNIAFGGLDDYWQGLSADQRAALEERGYSTQQALLGAVEGHFATRLAARGLTANAPNLPSWTLPEVSLARVATALAPLSFAQFGSAKASSHHLTVGHHLLESGPHNNVHGGVAGYMGGYVSPIDPIFWLHHANIDRLWDVWTRRQRAANRPVEPAGADNALWRGESFHFFCDAGGTPLSTVAADYTDLSALGYMYQPGVGENVLTVQRNAPSGMGTFFRTNTPLGMRLINAMEVAGTLDASPTILDRASADTDTFDQPLLVARVTLTPPPNAANIRIKVFINCTYLTNETPIEDPHYVGSIVFFGHHKASSNHHNSMTFVLPLNQTLQALRRNAQPVRRDIRVQLVTVSPDQFGRVLNGNLDNIELEVL